MLLVEGVRRTYEPATGFIRFLTRTATDITVAKAWTGICGHVGETAKWTIPADNLDILRSVGGASEVDFIAGDAVGCDRSAKPQLYFFEDGAVLVDGVDRGLGHLVRIPAPRENCR